MKIIDKLREFFREITPMAPSKGTSEIQVPSEIQVTSKIQVSLIIPARNSDQTLERTLRVAHTFLQARFPGAFEIILVPNSSQNYSFVDDLTLDDHSTQTEQQATRVNEKNPYSYVYQL